MAQINEFRSTANFLVSEANGMYRSRDEATVAAGAAPGLRAGRLLIKSGANFAPYTGTGTVAGILFEAAVGTVKKTVVTRDAEVNGAHLIYQDSADDAAKTAANTALAALGIIVR